MLPTIRILTLLSALLSFSAPLFAEVRPVTVPINVDYRHIQQLLVQQVFTGTDNSLRPWSDGTGCNYLTLTDPVVDGFEGRLRVISKGRAQVGAALGGSCISVLSWSGHLETIHELVLPEGQNRIEARIVDTQLLNDNGQAENMPNQLWTIIKNQVHPRLENLRVDLNRPFQDLKQFLSLLTRPQSAQSSLALIESLRLSEVTAGDDAVKAMLMADVALPDSLPDASEAPVAVLTAEELAQWHQQLDAWDGFFTYVTKNLAAQAGSPELQDELLDLLLDARYRLNEALVETEQGDSSHSDPVRGIFLHTWRRLGPIVQRIDLEQNNPASSLHYLSFIAAGDALKALDELEGSTNIEVSLNGLRRLARMVAPTDQLDPLDYEEEVDPELRKSFNFGEPPPLPDAPIEINFLNWLFSPAYAADVPAAFDPELTNRLNIWIPQHKDMPEYLPLAHKALNHAANATLVKKPLDQSYQPMFRHAMLATAWQESCWRQFVNKGGKRLPLTSPSGSVGIMQVNPRVWRGFYDVNALKWDLVYNAMAGSEILMHYLNDLAIRKGEHTITKNPENLARASYSAYNAGPGKLTRYRDSKATKREQRVDKDFFRKFQAMKKDDPMAVLACYGG
ncbi:lytic transglycosylase domain-containing protein [Allohahella marinimesophila]|uniref:Transglycosylase SLT domain-containing protein n=1 Tax=Allohahella marinimesophila TaxID=1054972 RepID=A0ABP7PZH1_9GAMM